MSEALVEMVSWRTVLWGLGLQFFFGTFVIRTDPGFIAFQWLGDQVQVFLNDTVAGSSFVFGDMLVKNVFAFQALPIILFFGRVMSVLYYLSLMQVVVQKMAWCLQVTMGTTATETLAVAGNVFMGMVICSYILQPMVFMMAVEWADCLGVAEVVGTKVFINEFVAYQRLSQYQHRCLF